MNRVLLVIAFVAVMTVFVAVSFQLTPSLPNLGAKPQPKVSCCFQDFSYGEGEGEFEFVLESGGASGRDWNYVRNLTDWYYLTFADLNFVEGGVAAATAEPLKQGMHHFFVHFSGNATESLGRQLAENRVELVSFRNDSYYLSNSQIVRRLSPNTKLVIFLEGSGLKDIEAARNRLENSSTDFDYYGFTYQSGWDWQAYDEALARMGKLGKPAVLDATLQATDMSVQAEEARQFLFYTLGRNDVKAVVLHSLKGQGQILTEIGPRPVYQELYRASDEKRFSPVYYIPDLCK